MLADFGGAIKAIQIQGNTPVTPDASGNVNLTLPVATSSALGGIKLGYTTSAANRNYAVVLSNDKAYVNVPWQETALGVSTVNATSGGVGIT